MSFLHFFFHRIRGDLKFIKNKFKCKCNKVFIEIFTSLESLLLVLKKVENKPTNT